MGKKSVIKKNDTAPNEEALTPLEEMFVREYLVDLNATQAMLRCKSYKTPRSAAVCAHSLLSKPKIQNAINSLFQERNQKTIVTVDEVLRELKMLASSDPREAYNPDGSIKNIHSIPEATRRAISGIETEHPIGKPGMKVIKIKFWPKDRGLEMIGRYLAMFVDRSQLEGRDGKPLAISINVSKTGGSNVA